MMADLPPRQLATYFLSQDESQLLYYEKRIKEITPQFDPYGGCNL